MLVRLALRLAIVRALRGMTLAGKRVFDSQIGELNQFLSEERAPVIVIYTDEEDAEVEGRDLMAPKRELTILFDMAVATMATVDDEPVYAVAATDAGVEAMLDVMFRQVHHALFVENNIWAEAFRQMAVRIVRMRVLRGAEDKGIRFAARQVALVVDTIAEPAYAPMVAGSVWERIVIALEDDDDAEPLGALMRRMIEDPALADLEAARVALGLPVDSASGLAVGEPDRDLSSGGSANVDPQYETDVDSETVETALPPEPEP